MKKVAQSSKNPSANDPIDERFAEIKSLIDDLVVRVQDRNRGSMHDLARAYQKLLAEVKRDATDAITVRSQQ